MENIPVRVTSSTDHRMSESPRPTEKKKRLPKKLLKVLLVVALLAAVGVGSWLYGKSTSVGSQIDDGKYQALFLTNGQVYFGKLKTLNDNYLSMSSIFYLQSTQQADSNNPQATASKTSDNVNLIKLGSEVHGPTDQMIISKQQVLFFENLKADGRVSASIDQYLKKK